MRPLSKARGAYFDRFFSIGLSGIRRRRVEPATAPIRYLRIIFTHDGFLRKVMLAAAIWNLPLIGALFGSHATHADRAEHAGQPHACPRVLRSDEGVGTVSRKMRGRMRGLTANNLPAHPRRTRLNRFYLISEK
jgi:hypothetical protein